jgi:hypothetical protein
MILGKDAANVYSQFFLLSGSAIDSILCWRHYNLNCRTTILLVRGSLQIFDRLPIAIIPVFQSLSMNFD